MTIKLLAASAALLATQVAAEDSSVHLTAGMGLGVDSTSNVGLTLSAAHHSSLSETSGVFVGTSLMVPGKTVSKSSAKSAAVFVGGSFKSQVLPASHELGLAAQVTSPADSEEKYEFAPAFYAATTYDLNKDIAIKAQVINAFAHDKEGDVSKHSGNLSIGVTYIAPVDSIDA